MDLVYRVIGPFVLLQIAGLVILTVAPGLVSLCLHWQLNTHNSFFSLQQGKWITHSSLYTGEKNSCLIEAAISVWRSAQISIN